MIIYIISTNAKSNNKKNSNNQFQIYAIMASHMSDNQLPYMKIKVVKILQELAESEPKAHPKHERKDRKHI